MGSFASDRSVPRSVKRSAGGFRMVDASMISIFACALRKCVSYVPARSFLLRQNEPLTCITEFGAADFGSPELVIVV